MTCIVALIDKNKVYMGADSLGSNSSMQRTVRKDEKVFIKDEMLFGFTGSFRMGQIIRYSLDIPPRQEGLTDMEYLVKHFITALIDCYEDAGFLQKPEGEEVVGGQFLLGYRGNLYDIQEDFQVGIPSLDYEACGCGEDLARGAMFALQLTDKKLTPEKKITIALDAATEHSAGVGKPYNILSI